MENVHLKFIQENYFYSNVNTSESWEVASVTFHLKKKKTYLTYQLDSSTA